MHSRHLLKASALVALLVLAGAPLASALPLHTPTGPTPGVELAGGEVAAAPGSPDDGERGVLIDPNG